MQRDLQIALIIIGGLVIVGILVHGFWTTRKQKKRSSENNFVSRSGFEPKFNVDEEEDLEYEDVVISPARVISDSNQKNADEGEQESKSLDEPSTDEQVQLDEPASEISASGDDSFDENDTQSIASEETQLEPEVDEESASDEKPIYSGVVTQPKPEFAKAKKEFQGSDEELPEPPSFLLKKQEQEREAEKAKAAAPTKEDDEINLKNDKHDEVPDFTLDAPSAEPEKKKAKPKSKAKPTKPTEPTEKVKDKELSFAEHAKRLVRRKKTVAEKIRKEPVIGEEKAKEDQMRIDFGDQASEPTSSAELDKAEEKPSSDQQSDVIILNVQTPNEQPISGAALLPMLLTLGFKFGEHDIFHRHVNTNGKGPILFSLTNMFKPGVFDIDNMENFTTQGVSLFMMLPIDGDPQQVFNMMHNAARKISDEFNGKILDANKVPISKQSLQQYAERIRDFERRRLTR